MSSKFDATPSPAAARRNSTARSQALFERALDVMPGGSTRATIFFHPHPPYAAHGQGSRIVDVDGNAILDFTNNFFSAIHGHANPATVAAVAETAARGISFGLPTEIEVDLAEHICARSPVFETIRFSNSGSEAVVSAIKAARAFTGRPAIAKIEGAYHGNYDHVEVSLDSAPANWGEAAPAGIKYARGTPDAVLGDTVVIPFNDPEAAIRLLEAHGSRLSSLLFDPLPSRVGLVPASPEFVTAIRETTRRLGIVLIVDEIVCFRLSHAGAHPLFDLEPDLVTLGKVIGGGLPIGAVTGRRDIMAMFDARPGKPAVPHGGTFTANPVTMAAGLASLRQLDHAAYDHLNGLGERLRQGLTTAFAQAGIPAQVTGMGSLFRVHPHARAVSDYRSGFPTADEKALQGRLHTWLVEQGYLLTPNQSGALSTPMTAADIDGLVDVMVEGFGWAARERAAA
ncbi:glutamate-1-semialdehyde 2,1-aminomutase [Stella humosa]|uniref:Glutamate-1-semialdehyde 2,1-aminomutase n=1 Tax=Stella humosa TaxID=94 RepID=A0A3N1L1G5_9PROT|nr:aspartate aminotransferase family protein [Stella humosa]ROP83365.1 glutamate-1-semialdehyde 2,1-aminomutase [Stella humosa]BBK29851.1 aspartate aminotransferase family protein [Stella humosa]